MDLNVHTPTMLQCAERRAATDYGCGPRRNLQSKQIQISRAQSSTQKKRRRGSAVGTTVERRCMLLCKVALGRQHIAQDNGFVNGFDPVTATPLGWSGTEVHAALNGADSVVAIPGTTPGINYDEAIIYDKSQAIPSYVVVYEMP